MTTSNARFWNKWAQRYSRRAVPDQTAYENKLNKTREYLNAHSQVLELGCGTGSTSLAHAPHVAHILATDFSDQMIAIAQQKAHQQGVANVTFKVASADQQLQTQNKFDMIMAHSLLHLLDNPSEVTQQIHTALKPGGVFVQNTVTLASSNRFVKAVLRLGNRLGLLPFINMLSQQNVLDDLGAAGFKIKHRWFHQASDALFVVAQK